MSVAVPCIDCTSNTSISNRLFNPENADLEKAYVNMRDAFWGNTNTFARPKKDTIDFLMETYGECLENNWDGQGASPAKAGALHDALSFIDNLPNTIPMPSDITVDSDGDISMEWRKRKGLIFDISFNGNNEIIYAGIFGTDKPRGVLYFSRSIPREIINKIQAIGV